MNYIFAAIILISKLSRYYGGMRVKRVEHSAWKGIIMQNISIISNRKQEESPAQKSDQLVLRGDLFYADLSPVTGSEQGGVRPVLVIQNDMGNRYSPTVIVAAITSSHTKAKLPTHVKLSQTSGGLKCDSTVLVEQIRTIDRGRLREYIGHLEQSQMNRIDRAMLTSLGLLQYPATAQVCF